MTGMLPVSPTNLRGMVSGGAEALAALTHRVGAGDADVAMELYQVAHPELLDAMSHSVDAGRRIDVLADARLPGGGMQEQVSDLARRSGGSLDTYGAPAPGLFQHAKAYHFSSAAGEESWITNLAPIPDTLHRTELVLQTVGDTAAAARDVARSSMTGNRQLVGRAIDSAALHGVLVNDPTVARRTLTDGIFSVLADGGSRDLLVITKGIEDAASTDAIIAAHRSGRNVRVLVRDIAAADADRLASAGVPAWTVSGGLKPRVNAVFAGNRGVVSSAFLWSNMVGDRHVATSRDLGVLVGGRHGAAIRDAALATVDAMPQRTPVLDAVRGGTLPEHI